MTKASDDRKLNEGIKAVKANAEVQAKREFWRHIWPRVVAAAVLVSLAFNGLVSFAVHQLEDRQTTSEIAITALRQQAEASKAQGEQANDQLRDRGQQPVPIPQPGTAPDTDVIVAAAAAKVMASIPNPLSTNALGKAIADYLAANPLVTPTPTPMQIATALAGYLAINPLPPGPEGKQGATGATGATGAEGKQGDPPTAEQIQSAFSSYIQQNPSALCPKGGSFAQLRIQLADGGAADTWQCVVSVAPSQPESEPPAPTN